jgi:hypothetical protein
MVSGSATPSVSGSVKMSRPASTEARPKVRKGTRLAEPPTLLPASTMKGATMPPTRAAWFSAPRTAERTCAGGVVIRVMISSELC